MRKGPVFALFRYRRPCSVRGPVRGYCASIDIFIKFVLVSDVCKLTSVKINMQHGGAKCHYEADSYEIYYLDSYLFLGTFL